MSLYRLLTPCLLPLYLFAAYSSLAAENRKRPNILFVISDDQSFLHASAYGSKMVETPAFNRVAELGFRFDRAYCSAPQCSPSRASILTGRNIWQLEEAGVLRSYFPPYYSTYPRLLSEAGYHVGYTGKGWSPGSTKGWEENPCGRRYVVKAPDARPNRRISDIDYTASFHQFLEAQPKDAPFCFWFGAFEPHRPYEAGSAIAAGAALAEAEVPASLPLHDTVRSDLLDYAMEIEWYDRHLGRILETLEQRGELANTLIIVTSDNGMPFPTAKSSLTELGSRIPLAICWTSELSGDRPIESPISLIDVAPTILEACGLEVPEEMTGKSLLPLLRNEADAPQLRQKFVLTGRERHTAARADNLCYPARAIHTEEYLLVWNLRPERTPMGDQGDDVDGSPTKALLIDERETYEDYYQLAFGMRPEFQLFQVKSDPYCLTNLAYQAAHAPIRHKLYRQLTESLIQQKDPRLLGYGDIFEAYPRFGPMRPHLGGFHESGTYHPEYVKRAANQLLKIGRPSQSIDDPLTR